MKVPYSWLRELVPGAPDDPAEAAELLMVSGTAVEAVHDFGIADAGGAGGAAFKVGRVLAWEQHPNADKLRLVRVDVGGSEPQQIICGASNFAEGDTVAVVLPGGRMPDGMEITGRELRGVASNGMMLSERELGLSTDHSGIMILPETWTIGGPLHERVPIGDAVLELEVTGNRPDCLGVIGVARELATACGSELDTSMLDGDADAIAPGSVQDAVSVIVDAGDLCPRYMARTFEGVTVGPSPAWLKARLAAAGMRSISNVVDVTNFVMLLTGQPLHAFDADEIPGGCITVRRALAGEQVTTLDDVERTLDPDVLVIAHDEGPAVIAGIMGAAHVEVTNATTRLVLESACFSGPSIQRTSRRLGLRSESSSRFEKGIDPHMPEVALRVASRLLAELCSARMVTGTIDVQAAGELPAPPVVTLPAGLPGRVLGIEVTEAQVEDALERLGYTALAGLVADEVDGPRGWTVEVPHWRMYDTTRAIDLVEEVGRFHLARVPATLPARARGAALLGAPQRLRRLFEDTCAGMGLREVVTYTMVPAGAGVDGGLAAGEVLALSNPMTTDHVELRGSLLASHLEVLKRSQSGGMPDAAIFEVGRTFRTAAPGALGADGLPRFADERDVLGLTAVGSLHSGRFDAPAVPADFAAAAGMAGTLLDAARVLYELRPWTDAPGFLHPGQAACIVDASGDELGWVAAVHPTVSGWFEVDGDVFAAELDMHAVARARGEVPQFAAFSEFPPVLEDLAFVLGDAVLAGDVVATARAAGGELLEDVSVFDRYVGAPIEDGHHSLALRLVFRAPDRTLVDEDVVATRTAVVDAIVQSHGGVLRSNT